mgnify:CR=1 FL=1
MIEVHQFPCLSDNYGFLLHDSVSGETACIDTPDAPAYLREAEAKGWRITQIWNTHWHPDHAGGNEAIKAATGLPVLGWLPPTGAGPGGSDDWSWDWLHVRHLVLPAITMSVMLLRVK